MEKAQTNLQKRKLPWDDDPRLGHYIDDNALFVLESVIKGHLTGKNASNYFFIASWHPLEWDIKILVKFLVRAAEEYSIELRGFTTVTYAFAEEYEEPIFDEKTGKPFAGYEKEWEKYDKKNQEYEKCQKKYKDIGDQIFECLSEFSMLPPILQTVNW